MKNTKKQSHRKPTNQKHRHAKRFNWRYAAIIAVAALIVVAGSFGTIWMLRVQSRTINRDGVKLSVVKIRYDTKGSMPFIAPPGWKFAIVDVSIKNTRDHAFDFAPVLQTSIHDSQNQIYEMSPVMLEHPLAAGKLQPGQASAGSLSYLVPTNASGLRFDFKTN